MNDLVRGVRRVFPSVLAAMLLCSTGTWGQVRITVKNPSSSPRPNEPVVVPWTEIARAWPAVDPRALQLADENGAPLTLQVDDLDFDGTPDELTFVADFGPGQERVFTAGPGKADTGGTRALRTDAVDWKRIGGVLHSLVDDDVAGNARVRGAYRFDGVGWESDVIAYRLYLDARNAIDINGKRKPGLCWDYLGTSGADYQKDAGWGMDILQIGNALGIGGIGFWAGDSVLKPITLDRQRTRIVARGPVRAAVRVEYTGWDVGGEKENVTSLFTIYAGDRVSEQRVILEAGPSPKTLATGIVRLDSTEIAWNPGGGYLYTTGRQSRANDGLMMALNVSPGAVMKKTEDAVNHLLILKLVKGTPLKILLSAYWQGEHGTMWTGDRIREFLEATGRRLTEPLQVCVAGMGR